jgi:hypothetical protein
MSFSSATPQEEPRNEPVTPCCPVCNGQLIELRGQYRCTRCYFTLCVGCESAAYGIAEED